MRSLVAMDTTISPAAKRSCDATCGSCSEQTAGCTGFVGSWALENLSMQSSGQQDASAGDSRVSQIVLVHLFGRATEPQMT